MQYNFGLDWSNHISILIIVIVSLVLMWWILRYEYNMRVHTSLFYHREKSEKFFKSTINFVFGFVIGFFLIVYIACYHLHIHVNKEDFEKRVKEPKHLIIKDKIVPITDTLIVIGDKKLGKTDTIQIEDFYKHQEFKNEH